ncbi:MAG: 50S ribosomal protein L18 [Candidatus Nanoarchaeia archaeon]
MGKKSTRAVGYSRKRQGKTDYKLRLTYLKSQKPRLVIRITGNYIIAHVVEYNPDGDMTKLMINSKKLSEYGWKYSFDNLPAAYLTGLAAAKEAQRQGVHEAVADLGMQAKIHGSRLFAVIKGAIDAGLKVPYSENCFPPDERIRGEHIQKFAQSIKNDNEKYQKQFSSYLKNNQDPEKIPEIFDNIKQKIIAAEK